jgi:hypothetical protein
VSLDLSVAQVILAVVLPAVVALVTKTVTHSGTKALVLLALSIVSGVLTDVLAQGGDWDLQTALGSAVGQFALAVVAHYGLLKPLNVTGSHSTLAAVGSPQGTRHTR